MIIFKGKKEADTILLDLKRRIKKEELKPRLAIVSIDPDMASELFMKNKRRAANKVGIKTLKYKFSVKNRQAEVIKKIEELNSNPGVHGIIVQLPLPKKFNKEKIITTINPEKDVDGFHRENRKKLKAGKPFFFPPFPTAIFFALRKSSRNLKGKKIVLVSRSDIFSQTLKSFLLRNGLKINFISINNFAKLKSVDVVITALGRPNFIKGSMLKKGVVLIDGGMILEGNKIMGDVDRNSVKDVASFLTPAPGGIGPLTVALLLKNVYLAENKI